MRTIALYVALATACGPTVAVPDTPRPAPTQPRGYARGDGFAGALRVRFSLGQPDHSIFAHPWPSEMDRRSDGKIDLRGFVGRDHFAVSGLFDEAEDHVLGYSVKPAIYVPFEGELDESSVARAIDAGKIRLIDIDPKSATRGRSVPVRHRIFQGATYVPEQTLALRPRGVLDADHLYAVVLERSWPEMAAPLGTTRELELVKGTEPAPVAALEAARTLHADAFQWLEAHGLPRAEVAGIALFRTQPALQPVTQIVRAVDQLPASQRPRLLRAVWMQGWAQPDYHVIRGYYCTPSFQSGLEHVPFIQEGGTIEEDASGRPQIYSIPPRDDAFTTECAGAIRARFVLTVPRGETPSAGWPLMVYAHGTTGDARSLLDGAFAASAASAGMAAVTTDQPLHGSLDAEGARPGSSSPFTLKLGPVQIPLPMKGRGGELAFYNVLRPVVLRDNLRQAIADGAGLARLMLATDFASATAPDGSLALAGSDGAAPPRFNRELGYVAAGHSQGSQSMAALGAVDPLARAALLSACGADFSSTMLLREDGAKVRRIAEVVLGLAPDELDEFHPFATAIQSMIDPVDPQSFASAYTVKPRSALLVSGVGDTMTVNHAGGLLAAAMRLRPIAPLPLAIDDLSALGIEPSFSVHANGPGGKSTLALLQLVPSYPYEPHFVAFNEPVARRVMGEFLAALARGEAAPRLAR